MSRLLLLSLLSLCLSSSALMDSEQNYAEAAEAEGKDAGEEEEVGGEREDRGEEPSLGGDAKG